MTLQFIWGWYRIEPFEPSQKVLLYQLENAGKLPTIDEDDLYLDCWMKPSTKEMFFRVDPLTKWKPPINDEGAKKHRWAIPLKRYDPSEWIHMTSKY